MLLCLFQLLSLSLCEASLALSSLRWSPLKFAIVVFCVVFFFLAVRELYFRFIFAAISFSHAFFKCLYSNSAARASSSGSCSPDWISMPKIVFIKYLRAWGLPLDRCKGLYLAVSRHKCHGWLNISALKSFNNEWPTTILPSIIAATSFCTNSKVCAAQINR